MHRGQSNGVHSVGCGDRHVLPALEGVLEILDEAAEREGAPRFSLPRELEQAERPREREISVPRGGQGEPARAPLQEVRQGLLDRPPGALLVQLLEQGQRPGDLILRRREVTSIRRHAEGMEVLERLAVREQIRVGERQERSAQGGVHGELVVGELDGVRGSAERDDLLGHVERAPAYVGMGDPSAIEGSGDGRNLIDAVDREAPRDEHDVTRGQRHLGAGARVRDPPPALPDHVVNQARDELGELLADPLLVDVPAVGEGPRHRERDHRRAGAGLGPNGREPGVRRLKGPCHEHRGTSSIDHLGDGGRAAKRGGELEQDGALRHQAVPKAEVPVHARATERIDRLLGIPDHEELARARRRERGIGDLGIRRGEERDDVELEGIGVLHLVHHHVVDARRQDPPHLDVVHQGAAKERDEIVEVERPLLLLGLLVAIERRHQVRAEERRQIRAGVLHERGVALEPGVPTGLERRKRPLVGPVRGAPRLAEGLLLLVAEAHQERLERVVVAGRHALPAPDLRVHPAERGEGSLEPIALLGARQRGLLCVGQQEAQLLDQRVHGLVAREAQRTRPGRREIALLVEGLERPREPIDGAGVVPLVGPSEPATQARRRLGEQRLEVRAHHALAERARLVLTEDGELGIDARLERDLAEQLAGDPVEGPDAGVLHLVERPLDGLPTTDIGHVAHALELRAETQGDLARRALGEGGRHDATQGHAALDEEPEQATHEERGLSAARRGLHHEAGVQIGLDPRARIGVDEDARPEGLGRIHRVAHRVLRRRTSASGTFLPRARSSSPGPHTKAKSQ